MTINVAAIGQLMRKGLNTIFGEYQQYPAQWKQIYKTYPSYQFQETDVEMKYLGAASIKPQGQPGTSEDMGQRIITTYIHKTISNSFLITEEAMNDNQYKSEFPKSGHALKDSIILAENVFGANILNNGFNPAYAIGDGQPVFSANHPIDGGVYSNTLAAGGATIDLSQAGLEQAILLSQRFPSQSGNLCQTKPMKLIVPPALQFVASTILNSQFGPGNANNGINPINHDNYIPEGAKTNQFLISPTAWFLLTDAPEGFKHFDREPIRIKTHIDPITGNIMFIASERLSFGVSNPRAGVGSPGV